MAAGVLTVSRLLLGQALKRLRAESGKTLDETAAVIGKSRARLINVLGGKGTLTAEELARLLDFLGANPSQKRELLELGAEASKRSARRPYDHVPGSFQKLADMEALATDIRWYERGLMPGLLQVPEYIEAQMIDSDRIWLESSWRARHDRLSFRLDRQKLIMEANPAKTMHFVITDDALRTEVGGSEVMKQQFEYLLAVMDNYPNITIQVLIGTTPHNPAPGYGLILLQLGDAQNPVAFLPVLFGPSRYLDDPSDTNRLVRAFDRLKELAMRPDDSRRFIADLAKHT